MQQAEDGQSGDGRTEAELLGEAAQRMKEAAEKLTEAADKLALVGPEEDHATAAQVDLLRQEVMDIRARVKLLADLE